MQCKICRRRVALESYRRKYLPRQVAQTRLKLAHLELEAHRLGVAL